MVRIERRTLEYQGKKIQGKLVYSIHYKGRYYEVVEIQNNQRRKTSIVLDASNSEHTKKQPSPRGEKIGKTI